MQDVQVVNTPSEWNQAMLNAYFRHTRMEKVHDRVEKVQVVTFAV